MESSFTFMQTTLVNVALELEQGETDFPTIAFLVSAPATITSGVLTFEGSADGGTTWTPVDLTPADGTVDVTHITFASAAVLDVWRGSAAGFDSFRVRLSTVLGGIGNAVVKGRLSN